VTCPTHSTGKFPFIDRGRVVTVLNQDKAAVLFGLEMAIQKYGTRIACTGTVEWKRMVSKVAAQHGISVQFTDPEMQHALRVLQRLANPRQRQQERAAGSYALLDGIPSDSSIKTPDRVP